MVVEEREDQGKKKAVLLRFGRRTKKKKEVLCREGASGRTRRKKGFEQTKLATIVELSFGTQIGDYPKRLNYAEKFRGPSRRE